MKNINIIIFSILSFALLIQSCSFEDCPHPIEQQNTTDFTHPILTRSDANTVTSSFIVKPKVITKETLAEILSESLKGTSIKDTKHYSLKTFSEDGFPIIHSVNFDNGGWALVAGRELPENQLLAYSEEGTFNPDDIESPEVLFWFNITKLSLKQSFDYADREAEAQQGLVSPQEEEDNIIDSFSFDDPYVWVRLDLGSQNSIITTNVNHLTETQWGQGYPWNYKCPYIGNNQCVTGCGIVAVSQMLYYLHFYLGTPSGCYNTIDTSYTWHNPVNEEGYYSLDLNRADYTAPSARWVLMAQTNPYTLNNSTKYVGNLMMDVADRLGAKFKASGTYASINAGIFTYYNIDCTYQQYNSSQTISQLDNSMPVIVRGTDSSSSDAHAWLIDGYKKEVTMTDHQYKWVMMPPDSLQYYNNINYDYVFTESEMQQYYPNVVENQIDHDYSYSSPNYLFRMNWGYDGFYNNGLYSIQPSGWYVDGHLYCLSTYMITGFDN